jgi:hypothetical protein
MAAKQKPQTGKREYVRKSIDDRIVQAEAKLGELKLKKKTKDDPAAKQDIATIRRLRKIPNPTAEMRATIEQLTKRLGG